MVDRRKTVNAPLIRADNALGVSRSRGRVRTEGASFPVPLPLSEMPSDYAAVLARLKQRIVAAQKLDGGLGELPHHRHWTDPTGRGPMGQALVGEKQDSGLGELPHYRHWKDKTGRDPMGECFFRVERPRLWVKAGQAA